MRIYLVRHGESGSAASDNERSLTTKGKNDINNLAKLLAPLNLAINQLFHSEKLRAIQTAEILMSCISLQNPAEAREELAPNAPVSTIIREMLNWDGDTMLVGHMPFLGELASRLVLGTPNRDIAAFTPGSMLCLEEIERNHWVIVWMLSSELHI